MSIFAVAFVIIASLLAIVLPWLGVMAYYLFSVMQMQYLWPHDFGEGRVSLILTGATLIGLAGASALKLVDWRVLLTPYAFLMALLLVWVNLSMEHSGFISYVDPTHVLSRDEFLETFNKTVVFFFVACLLINTRTKLECCIYLLAFMTLFYTAWANKVYLTGEFWRFGDNGRLSGPLRSVYVDENTLAILFVIATPVLYYIGIARSNFFIRYGIWLTIPLTWHALFLTGSRGGMLALATVCVYIFFRSFHKLASIGIVVGLVLAIVFQGGQLLTRVDTTIDANEQLQLQELEGTDEKLDPRLISWGVALEIMQKYPMFGVGVENFFNAFPEFSNTNPHVVHNTFLQFAANCGVLAGLIYLWFFFIRVPTLRRSAKIKGRDDFPRRFSRDYLDDLLNSLYLGFFVVAVFLDLMIYEILYFLIMLGFAKYTLDRATEPKQRGLIDSIYRIGQANDNDADRNADKAQEEAEEVTARSSHEDNQPNEYEDYPVTRREFDGRSRNIG